MNRIIHGSLARNADFGTFQVEPLPRSRWAWGDYVVGEVVRPGGPDVGIETCHGRMMEVMVEDRVLGALGTRAATLELTGTWESIAADGRMAAITAAGMFGGVTSRSPFTPRPVGLVYVGHVIVDGTPATMRAFAPRAVDHPFDTPTILIVGSSMSAGKTASARILIRRLKARGLRVVAAKLTGAGRWRDALSMRDAGADAAFDFVDAGLPSTVCPREVFDEATRGLLARMGAVEADIAVIEAGASPLEPYNGEAAVALIEDHLAFLLLCASDPYAVAGMVEAFGRKPDLVAGIACNTLAGMALVDRLTGLPAMRLTDPAAVPALDALLEERLPL